MWACGGKINGVASIGQPAKVISMSFTGSGACPSFLQSAVTQAIGSGSIVVAAAGNSAEDVSDFVPANCVGVLSVGASTEQGKLAEYSNWGSSILAPGGPLWAMTVGGALAEVQGTSFATPHAAGLLARLLLLNGSAAGRLLDGAQALNGSCLTETCSAGIADYQGAILIASQLSNPGWQNSNVNGTMESNVSNVSAASYQFLWQEGVKSSGTYIAQCSGDSAIAVQILIYVYTPSSDKDVLNIWLKCRNWAGTEWLSSKATNNINNDNNPDQYYFGSVQVNSGIQKFSAAEDSAHLKNIIVSDTRAYSDGTSYSSTVDNYCIGSYLDAIAANANSNSDTHINAPNSVQYHCKTLPCTTSCGAGKYLAGTCNGNANTYCTNCAAGTYSNAGAASCTGCSPGTYSGENSGSCTSCTSSCASGQYLSTACSSTANAVCSDCPAGSYCANTVKTQCSAGTYSAAGASSCTACSTLGTYSDSGASSCTQCTPQLTTCAAGYYINQTLFTSCNTYGCVKCLQIKSICCGTGYYADQTTPDSCIWTCVPCNNSQAGVKYYISYGDGDNYCGAPLDKFNANACYTANCFPIPVGYYSLCSGSQDNGARPCSNAPANSYSYYYYLNSSLPVQTTNNCPNALCPPCPAGMYTPYAPSYKINNPAAVGGCANTVLISGSILDTPFPYGFNIADVSRSTFRYCSAACPSVANAHYGYGQGADPQLESSACSVFYCNSGYYKSGGACLACPWVGCNNSFYRGVCAADGSDVTTVSCYACTNKPSSALAYSYGPLDRSRTAGDSNSCLWLCAKGAWYDSSRNMCVDCVARSDCPVGQYSDAACLTTDGMTVAPSCSACEDVLWGDFTGPGLTNDKRSCPFTCQLWGDFIAGYTCTSRSRIICPSWTRYVEGNSTSDNSCTPCDMTGIFAPYKAYMQQCVAGGYSNDACSQFESAISARYVMDSRLACWYNCANGYRLQTDNTCGLCPQNTYYDAWHNCLQCTSPQYTACNTVATQCLPADPHAAAALTPSDACTASNPNPFYCNAGFYAAYNDIFMTYACESCGKVLSNASYIAPDPLNRYPCTTSFFLCNAGYYANITAFQCVACPASTLSNTIWAPLDTVAISLSDIPAQLSASCSVACNIGYFLDANARACVPCPAAYYCPDYTAKVLCNSSYYCPAFTVVPVKCAPAFYCPNTTSQVACPVGSYNNISGATVCVQCTPQITTCTAGYYISQTSFTSCKTYGCVQCPQTTRPCCGTGNYGARTSPGSCIWTCVACNNAQAGVQYYTSGADNCGAPVDSLNANACYTANCSSIPVGYYSLCSGVQDSGVRACTNAPANSYYYSNSSLPVQTTITCPTALCPPCAIAGMYTPYASLYKQNNPAAVGGCANTVLISGSILNTTSAYGFNIADVSRNTFRYCSAACPSVANAHYRYISGADPQLESSVCSVFYCNSGYYNSGGACLACPWLGCNNSFYRGACASDGSDLNTAALCYPCTNKPNSPLAYSYGDVNRNRVAGDASSCLWLCAKGAWYDSTSNQCVTCAAKTDCPVGQYSLAECFYLDGITYAATCQSCAQLNNANLTGVGAVNNGTSCSFTCNYGYFASGYLCKPWTTPSCPVWTSSTPGTRTTDATCAQCSIGTAVPYASFNSNIAQCVSGGYSVSECSGLTNALSLAYQFVPNTCSFQCMPGYQLQGGLCVQCPINYYNPYMNRTCLPCVSPSFTPCSVERTYCASGIANLSGLVYTDGCANGKAPFYCNGGYHTAVNPDTLANNDKRYICVLCSNNPPNYTYLAPDPSNQCTSPTFTCIAGYYANYTTYQCLPCRAGSFSVAGASDCSTCAAGQVWNGSACRVCHRNVTDAATGTWRCLTCSNNFYWPSWAGSCVPSVGYYRTITTVPPAALQLDPGGNSLTTAVLTVAGNTFQAFASDVYDSTMFYAADAFQLNGGNDVLINTLGSYDYRTGAYTGSSSLVIDGVTVMGFWVKLQMSNAAAIAGFSFIGRACRVKLAGSADGNVWTQIQTTNSNPDCSFSSVVSATALQATPLFTYLAIIVPDNCVCSSGIMLAYIGRVLFQCFNTLAIPCANTCSAGTVAHCDASGNTACCGPGYTLRDGVSITTVCEACVPGSYSSRGAMCDPCADGSYSAAGASGCGPCAAGYYCVGGLQTVCNPGYYSNGGVSACSLCSASYSCINGLLTKCTDGFVSAAGASACDLCTAGYECVGGVQTACNPGYYSNSGVSACSRCSIGQYSLTPRASTCMQCDAGTFTDTTGSTVCTLCRSGSSSLALGAYSPEACVNCDVGTYSHDGASACTPCYAGTYAETTGLALCAACWQGGHSPVDGMTTCTSCAAGTYSLGGASACTPCYAGTYAETTGLALCAACWLGAHSPVDGMTTCTSCSAGTYANQTGLSICAACWLGTHSNVDGMTTCTSCAAGTYSNQTGLAVCPACWLGTYSYAGATTCTKCSDGLYINASLSTCTQCTAGSFCVNGIQTQCALGVSAPFCAACSVSNTYSPAAGASACLQCPTYALASLDGKGCLCAPGTFWQQSPPACVPCASKSIAPGWGTVGNCTTCYFGIT